MRFFAFLCVVALIGCSNPKQETKIEDQSAGKLFIIGGGKRPPQLIKRLVRESAIDSTGYGIILPMSSSEPDSAIFYALIQFTDQGLDNVIGFDFNKGDTIPKPKIDSIANANLIYISGGDQNKFMDIVSGTPIEGAIKACYENGGVIAGTSAGAAVMSKKMITGNELKYPDYYSTFRNIETNNIELKQGLGFIKEGIIDQHFVKRSRHNRLISAILENPNMKGIGIDESTAILVTDGVATVVGESQVLVFDSPNQVTSNENGKLSAKSLNISIFTADQTFPIK
ncbi:MAG: cyanophycinase [bacterium]|nr:cyanophycinase [bacterium]